MTTSIKPFVAEQKEVGAKYENDHLGVTLSLFDINKQRGIMQNGVFSDSGEYVHRLTFVVEAAQFLQHTF